MGPWMCGRLRDRAGRDVPFEDLVERGVDQRIGTVVVHVAGLSDIVASKEHEDRSARKHGVRDGAIAHAIDHAFVVVDLDPDADPPRVLAIGPDEAGNLLEVIWLEFPEWSAIVMHALRLRRAFYGLLPGGEEEL